MLIYCKQFQILREVFWEFVPCSWPYWSSLHTLLAAFCFVLVGSGLRLYLIILCLCFRHTFTGLRYWWQPKAGCMPAREKEQCGNNTKKKQETNFWFCFLLQCKLTSIYVYQLFKNNFFDSNLVVIELHFLMLTCCGL